MKVEGKSYTSNNAKLLKHLDVLEDLSVGQIHPIMIHLAPTNVCNLDCDFCCFADRNCKETLSLEDVVKVLDSFKVVGTKAVEFTGGGEPTLYKHINEVIHYANHIGYKIGMCTNSTQLDRIKDWEPLEWVRLSLNLFDKGKEPDITNVYGVDKSAAYVWDNPDIDNFHRMIKWAEQNKIPTRIAANAIKPVDELLYDMKTIEKQMDGYADQYVFLSDFNLKTDRRNNHCYMHMLKPFIFPDGKVYSCPSFELSYENGKNVNQDFMICNIDEIIKAYTTPAYMLEKNCGFCKYAAQNELIDDLLTETKHNDFA